MKPIKKLKNRRGFTLAELLMVVAIITVLAGVAFAVIDPRDVSHVEYDRSAEAIAAAVQNRLTDIRNSGDMEQLRRTGEAAAAPSGAESTAYADDTAGGYRYVFNYTVSESGAVAKTDMSYILPFGAIEYELSQNYYAIGFQSDTGMVGEVYYSPEPFGERTVAYLALLQGNAAKRKAENVGYYQGTVDSAEVAFANLPTPQLTIINYEDLTLRIRLPEVKQLQEQGKEIGILVSLADKDGAAYADGLDLNAAAIYSTFALGKLPAGIEEGDPVICQQKITPGETYSIILDTVQPIAAPFTAMQQPLAETPRGVFEDWAKRSDAFRKNFLLGENTTITVTVYALYGEGDGDNYNEQFPIDPTFMPRSASVTFNGWFNDYDGDDTVDIGCGRHLQNLGELAELQPVLVPYLPTVEETDGVYSYSDYTYGKSRIYTEGSSSVTPAVKYEHITEKYVYRSDVQKKIDTAIQVNAIDFSCAEWRNEDGTPIPFTPVNLAKGFHYYGNYLSISHLFVDAPFYAGLFSYAYQPRFYDILLVNSSVTSHMPARLAEVYEMGVGALIGTSRDSSHINNCQVAMMQENGTYSPDKYRVQGECYVGGLIGFCEDEHIENCSASVYTGYRKNATKTVRDAAGGTTEEAVSSRYVGGLVGCITGDSRAQNCYAAGNLSGEYVGGLVGFIFEDSDPAGDDYRIESCYTAGHIEYASKEAAGILGRISELGGNAKSALSIYGNYCVVIYGEETVGGGYQWTAPAPIYATFRGDGFEWLRTATLGFYDAYITGKFGGEKYFASAVFENDNKNYYIAQTGIVYNHSPYYTALSDTVKSLETEISSLSGSALIAKVTEAKEKIFWLKKLQALDELKEVMEKIVYEVDSESGEDAHGGKYNVAGKSVWLDMTRAEIHTAGSSCKAPLQLSAVQAVHVLYDGTYTDDAGTEQTVKITYEGSSYPTWRNAATGIESYTFMGFYNKLKEAFTTLSTDTDNTAALNTVTMLLGDDSRNTIEDPQREFYSDGLFRVIFEKSLLRDVFSKSKNYYTATATADSNGKLLYNYLSEDLANDKFDNLLCDLGMSIGGREVFVATAKATAVQEAIDGLKDYPTIINMWKNEMASLKDTAKTLVSTTTTTLTALITALKTYDVGSAELDRALDDAGDAMQALWQFFESNKNKKDVVNTDGGTSDMRTLRSPIENTYLCTMALCKDGTANSGIELAIDQLALALGKSGADESALKTQFANTIDQFCSSDSGQRVKNAEEVYEKIVAYYEEKVAQYDAWGRSDLTDYGFMYNYGKHYSSSNNPNPYEKNVPSDAVVYNDNGIYNNVFPYRENAYTKYYPFPYVFGRAIEDTKSRPLFVLFHYGDWLTEDLWADADPVKAALYGAQTTMAAMQTGLQEAIDEAGKSGSTGNLDSYVTALSNAISACETQVQTALAKTDAAARNTDLNTIGTTISGWLEPNGAFTALVNQCARAKKEIAALIQPKLTAYKTQLQDLIDQIENAVT